MKLFPTLHCRKIVIFVFWLMLWQFAALLIKNPILMAGPWEVFRAFFRLLPEKSFWLSITVSFAKISAGFFLAFFTGIAVGWLAFFHPLLDEFLAPVIAFMKSVPVASFVILALIWMGSGHLSSLITFLVVFPVIYVHTIAGLKSTDKELLEMAQVFKIKGWRKGRCLYWPSLLPYLDSSCKTALGMSWKSGIAAEVIGVPEGTIGEQLYLSKIYLNTAELFAWTLVIILVSAGFERLFLMLFNKIGKKKPVFFRADKSFFLTGTSFFKADKSSLRADKSFLRTDKGSLRADKSFLRTDKSSLRTDKSLTADFFLQDDGIPFTLSVTNLKKQFGALEVFNRQSFSFSSEKIYCIMAASGFGKTTLFRILLGLEKAEEGEITPSLAACPASAVFQENRLCLNLSPVDNLLLAVPKISRKEAEKELSCLLPAECLNRPVSTLSGGMKRRAAIVRAVCSKGKLLFMDEPFTGLDEETKQETARYILSGRRGRLLIFSSHQEEDAQLLGAEILRFDA